MNFNSIEEIIDYAIEREEMAAKLYASLADKVKRPGMKEAFMDFAAEEGRHRARLMKIKAGELPLVTKEKVLDLKITEYLVEPKFTPNMTYPDALLFAMKSEKLAFTLYTRLAAVVDNPALSEVFASLAQEEAKHKLTFEIEYEDHVLEGV